MKRSGPLADGDGRALRAVFIGSGSLLIQCSQEFLARGHEVVAIVSRDPRVHAWAGDRGLDRIEVRPAMVGDLARRAPFDLLFSVVNDRILPPAVLRLPSMAAINYHNSPLPRYAGTNGPTWALLAGDESYGVTWHEMVEEVDAGDVLEARTFPVAPDETAFGLNMRCYEAARESFRELIVKLEQGSLQPRPQDLGRRTFFPRHYRPEGGGLVDWRESASKIDAMVRAFDFGSAQNPVALPKLYLGAEVLALRRTKVRTAESGKAPGTVVGSADGSLVVATGEGDLLVREVSVLDGRAMSLATMVARHRLLRGKRFPLPDESFVRRVTDRIRAVAPQELHWVRCLARARGAVLWSEPSTPSPARTDRLVTNSDRARKDLADWLAGIVRFVASETRVAGVDVAVSPVHLRDSVAGLCGIFSSWLPVRVEAAVGDLWQEALDELAKTAARDTFAVDVFARYPRLRYGSSIPPALVGLVESAHLGEETPVPEAALQLVVAPGDDRFEVVWDPSRLAEERLRRLVRFFSAGYRQSDEPNAGWVSSPG